MLSTTPKDPGETTSLRLEIAESASIGGRLIEGRADAVRGLPANEYVPVTVAGFVVIVSNDHARLVLTLRRRIPLPFTIRARVP